MIIRRPTVMKDRLFMKRGESDIILMCPVAQRVYRVPSWEDVCPDVMREGTWLNKGEFDCTSAEKKARIMRMIEQYRLPEFDGVNFENYPHDPKHGEPELLAYFVNHFLSRAALTAPTIFTQRRAREHDAAIKFLTEIFGEKFTKHYD